MNDQKKRICLIIPSLHAGGMERVMSELASFFAQKAYIDLHLILYGKNPSVFYSLPQNMTLYKPDFDFIDRYRLWFTLKSFWFLRNLIKKIQPDSILSFGEYWNSFVLIALLGIKVPVFISDRCQPDKQFSSFHTMLRRWLYPQATGIIVQTDKAREIYSEQFMHRRIALIGNPIRKVIRTVDINQENLILTVGRLIQTKHHNRLVKIFSRLNSTDWKLIIIGGNALKQNNFSLLQKMIEDLGLKDKVLLTGELNDVDIYYLKSKIFVFTSSSEGFPNVIGEALSAGLPVVSYDCIAGPSDMITDGENGFLVPVFDDNLFLKRLQLLIDDEERRQKMSAIAPASIERYSGEKIGEQYLDFILS